MNNRNMPNDNEVFLFTEKGYKGSKQVISKGPKSFYANDNIKRTLSFRRGENMQVTIIFGLKDTEVEIFDVKLPTFFQSKNVDKRPNFVTNPDQQEASGTFPHPIVFQRGIIVNDKFMPVMTVLRDRIIFHPGRVRRSIFDLRSISVSVRKPNVHEAKRINVPLLKSYDLGDETTTITADLTIKSIDIR